MVPRFPEHIAPEFLRLTAKLRVIVVLTLIPANAVGRLSAEQAGFDMTVYWRLWVFVAVTQTFLALLSLWMWRGKMAEAGLRRATYVCMTIETVTTLGTMWVYGTVSSHMIIFAVVLVLVYRLAFDFRIGATALAIMLIGQWTFVIAETSGWLPAQPMSGGRIDLIYAAPRREVASMIFITIMMLFIFASANWAVARMRHKEMAIRILRESLHASEPGEVGRHTGRILNDTYSVGSLLGAGAMGEVYAGRHRRTQRDVAIKLLHPHLVEDAEVLKRFRREAEITGSLGSDNIVEIIDMDQDHDQPFIVLELLDGSSVDQAIDAHGPMAWNEVVDLARQVARGLDAAHDAGVVHRDLKPGNVIRVRDEDGNYVAKILDFGVSKIHGNATALTQEIAILGTPNFMSPEQAVGIADKVDARTDIFALGGVLYNAITGERPFAATSVPALLRRICDEEPVPLHEMRANVPEGVADVLAIAMAKDRDERYARAGELARDLEAAVAGRHDPAVAARAAAVSRGQPATRTRIIRGRAASEVDVEATTLGA